MIGTTLGDVRDHIEALASTEGEYSLLCSRYGDQPVPATGLRLENRPTARAAAQATEQYRAALHRCDRLPYYDVIVQQASGPHGVTEQSGQRTADTDVGDRCLSSPVLGTEGRSFERRELVEFCHRVAATVFETLPEEAYDVVETVVMDACFELTETMPLSQRSLSLPPRKYGSGTRHAARSNRAGDVLSGAADRLTTPLADEKPIVATFARLQALGVLRSYTRSPCSIALDDGTRSAVVQLSEYAFSPQSGRFPVLPVVLDLYRRSLDWPPSAVHVADAGDGWRIRLMPAHEAEPKEIASVPLQSREPQP